MRPLLRKIRGALGLGSLWAAAWGIIGVGLGVAQILLLARSSGMFPPAGGPAFSEWIWWAATRGALYWGGWGFVTGILFSLVLALRAAREDLQSVRMPTMFVWGSCAGAVPAVVVLSIAAMTGSVVSIVGSGLILAGSSVLGATSAMLSLRIARSDREPKGRQESVEGGDVFDSLAEAVQALPRER